MDEVNVFAEEVVFWLPNDEIGYCKRPVRREIHQPELFSKVWGHNDSAKHENKRMTDAILWLRNVYMAEVVVFFLSKRNRRFLWTKLHWCDCLMKSPRWNHEIACDIGWNKKNILRFCPFILLNWLVFGAGCMDLFFQRDKHVSAAGRTVQVIRDVSRCCLIRIYRNGSLTSLSLQECAL